MMLGSDSEMPSAKIADQGSLLWGSFLELSFFGIIIAHARVMILLALTTLLPNLNVDNSATMLSLSAATYPAARIIWERPHRKPPDKSAEQYWLRKPPNIHILQCRPRKPPDKSTEQHWLRKPHNNITPEMFQIIYPGVRADPDEAVANGN